MKTFPEAVEGKNKDNTATMKKCEGIQGEPVNSGFKTSKEEWDEHDQAACTEQQKAEIVAMSDHVTSVENNLKAMKDHCSDLVQQKSQQSWTDC